MVNKRIKFLILFSVFIFSSFSIFSQNYNIDYYGVVSSEIDANMSKMTSDLYYTQLSEINNFNVKDKRNGLLTEIPDSSDFSDNVLSFFTEIKKDNNSDKWIAKLYVVDKSNQEIHSKEKKYDSYYKILMESKNDLKENIRQLIENDTNATKVPQKNTNVSFESSNKEIVSTETLAGTWAGEESIEKIVILRGGRGFVIFKNGASMNITVELDNNNNILVTQKGRGNASFYPELPRNLALSAALTADPIQWILTFDSSNSLTGIKNTLLPNGDEYVNGSVKIKWNKIN